MQLTVRIRFKDASGQEASVTVHALQKVIIGSSPAADVQLHDPRDVEGKHCEVLVSNNGCSIRSISARTDFEVNGRMLREVELSEFSELRIGHNEIEIQVVGLQEVDDDQQDDGRIEPESAAKVEFVEPNLQVLANGLRYFEFQSSEYDLKVLGDKVLASKAFFVTQNARSENLELAQDEVDLLQDFPEEFKSENSLALSGPFAIVDDEEGEDAITAIQGCLGRPNSLMIVPKDREITEEKFLDKLRLLVAWIARPSSLDFHLTNGIEFLLESIFADIQLLVYQLESDKGWKVITNDESVELFSDLSRKAETAHSAAVEANSDTGN